MNYINNNQNNSRQQTSAPSRAGCGTCAVLCMLLALCDISASAANFTETGPTLNLLLNTNSSIATITSTGTSYSIVLSGVETWSGSDSSNVTGNGTATLTVTAAGIAAYSLGGLINITNTGTADTVIFGTSTGSYANFIHVKLTDTGDSIQINDDTTFSSSNASNGLQAHSAGTLSVAAGKMLTAAGGSGLIELFSAGALTVNTGATINSAFLVSIRADSNDDSSGNTGTDLLSISGTVTGPIIQLAGGDFDISSGTIGDSSTMSILISPALITASMSLGTTVPGTVNLSNTQMMHLTVAANGGNVAFGDPSLSGDIYCSSADLSLAVGTGVTFLQDSGSTGHIYVNTGGTALDVHQSGLELFAGMGGLVVGSNPNSPIAAYGVTIQSGPVFLSLSMPPMNGDSYTIIVNSGPPIMGTFSNATQGGTVTVMFAAQPYNFMVDYAGNGEDDFTLTYAPPSGPPIVTTTPATAITAITATLNGTVDGQGAQTDVIFEFGKDTSYGMMQPAMPATIAGDAPGVHAVTADLINLDPATTYHFRTSATNPSGTVTGSDMTFSTPSDDANLSSLTFNTGTPLNPGFNSDILNYDVTTIASSIVVTPTVEQAAATIKVNGTAVASGQGLSIPLSLGTNNITIDVTAQDLDDTNSYIVMVTRNTPITSTLIAVDASATFNQAAQNLTLSATVTGASGTVNDGTVTFQLNDGAKSVGGPVTSTAVTNGSVSVTYPLPAGSPAQTYIIFANYGNSNVYDVSSNSSHHLTVNANTSTTAATSIFAPFNSAAYNVTLDASVTSPSGVVNEGTVTFQLQDSGGNLVGTATQSPTVSGGAAEVTYTVPANTPTGAYTIAAVYSGSSNISGSTDRTQAVSIAVDLAPTITDFETNNNPALLNTPVTYLFSATDPDTATLTYVFDFGDGTQPQQGTFAQGTNVSVSHTYTAYTVGAAITLTVSDGYNPVTATDTLVVPMPNSGASNVPNVNQGQPPIVTPITTPLGGISVQVQSSDAGVIQLNIDVDSLTRDAYSVSTDWGDISGRTTKVPGTKPVHVYNNRGIFVAKTTATNKSTNAVAGKARITLPLSSKETGDFPANVPNAEPGVRTHATNNTSITTKSLKGKFNFSGSKTDTVTYSGAIQLPAGITIGQPHEFWIGIGNIIVTTTLDKNGKGSVPGSPGILKSLKVTSKLKKGQTSVGGEPATVTCTYSTMAMVANGFDTEGIDPASSDLPKGKSTSRMIQVAMLLDGSPFQSLAPVSFSKSANSSLGTISGRSAKP